MAKIDEGTFREYTDGQDRLTAQEYMRDREVLRQAINDNEDKYEIVNDVQTRFDEVNQTIETVNQTLETVKDTLSVTEQPKESMPALKIAQFGVTNDTKEIFVGNGSENIKLLDENDKAEIGIALEENIKQLENIVYHMPPSNGLDDTLALQNALSTYRTVDLNNDTYYTNRIDLMSDSTIQNGNLIGIDTEIVIRGVNLNNPSVKNVTVNGQSICAGGMYFEKCNNVLVENCVILNFITRTGIAYGVFLNGCKNSEVLKTKVENVIATPNSIIGDDLGTSRGILFSNVTYSLIELCSVKNILGSDDADGIHFNASNNTKGYNIVNQNRIANCESRMIKVQQSDIKFINNELVTDADYSLTTPMRVGGISIYASNIVFEKNTVNCQSLRPVQIGAGNPISNITIDNNIINGYFGTGQACIVISDTPLISNCVLSKNKITGNGIDRAGVDIRTYFKNLRIDNNDMVSVIYGVSVRSSDGFFVEGTSVRESLLISDNQVTALNHLLIGNTLSLSTDLVTRLVCTNNTVTVTNVIAYIPNSVNLSSAQFNKKPIILNNSLSGVWIDGQPKSGSSSSRPTVVEIGYTYFDQTLGKPIWWNGNAWVDSTKTVV